MPNHVVNELIFRSVDAARQEEILRALCDTDGRVDFDILVPSPRNVWQFSISSKHEKAFGLVGLDWARQNWGTKWNAYNSRPVERTSDNVTLCFDTAWRPPYPWLAAVFNTFKCRFEHNWLDEGGPAGMGVFNWPPDGNDMRQEPWTEREPNEVEHRRLHKMRWGVESFEDDAA